MQAAVDVLGPAIAERQEVLAALADVLTEAYAVDSAVCRSLQSPGTGPDSVAEACVRLYALEAHERAHSRARDAVRAAVPETTACRAHLAGLRSLLDEDPADVHMLRERIAEAVVQAGRYPISRE
jgi:hypothetical protein